MKVIVLALVGFSVACICAAEKEKPAAAAEPATVRATSQEVVLDMVFRTKKGKPVRDIRPEEIHVYEDGAEQKLASFRLVQGSQNAEAPPETAMPAGAIGIDPMREIRLVTLVFEGLDQDSKRFFHEATKDLLALAPETNLYYSLFAIDRKLYCLQPFTQDHAALMRSIERAAMWNSYLQYSSQSAQVREQLAHILAPNGVGLDMPSVQGGPQTGPSAAQVGDMISFRLAKLQYDLLQVTERADRELDAFATLNVLRGLVRQIGTLPGRKVILYFNPWFNVPDDIKERYQDLISVANRGNVTFYTVDTKGLLTWSQNSAGVGMMSDANNASRRLAQSGGTGDTGADQILSADTGLSALRSNSMLWLKDLAQSTGGSLVGETNDLKAPLRLALDEIRTYYEATYVPSVTTWDGKFRKLAVKIDRPDVQVRTRSGYYALPSLTGGQQLASYELPLLNALNAPKLVSDVPFHAAAQRFSDRGPKVEYMVSVEAPLRGLTFDQHADKNSASVNTGILAVIKDQRGEIVEKFSKDFAVQVALDKVESYKQGNMVQTFHTELAPGDYMLEAAVMDRKGLKTGVLKSALHVPQPSNKLSVSNVVIVRRADALKNNDILDAFYYDGGKIVPALTDTLKGGPGSVLSFYFAVYRDTAVQGNPTLTMGFYKEGQYLGSADAPLPPPQKDGRIPYIASLPGDKFVPGSYEIHVGVTQGQEKAEEKVAFRIE
ncbi:MAG TPA: VWA domain-containing protein [Bryobacteraceae bacterium]|nr:VWA domain-containing protein [Bryobacteraceae bacterium]